MVVLAVAVLAATACSSASTQGQAPAASPNAVVVASFNFPESELLAEIYAQALEHAGVPVQRQLNLGTRELVLPALHQGLIDFVPEYLGSAVASLEPAADLRGASAADEVGRLARDLAAWGVQVRPPAGAENQNGLAVTRTVAEQYGLRAISGLAPLASRFTLGGPSECPTRPFCLVGLRDTYQLRFGRFVAFDGEAQRVTALDQGVVDVAVMFTTDGQLATGKFVLLDDDRHLQPAENIAPLVSDRAAARYGDRLLRTIDTVSSKLDTSTLVFLNWRVGVAGKTVASEARAWLQRQGLISRP